MRMEEIGIEEWSEVCKRCPKATLFHTREWLQILREGFSHIEIKLYAIINEENRTVGLLPVEFVRKGPFKLGGSPLPGLFTPYQGPLLLELSNAVLRKVPVLVAKMLRVHYFALSLPPDDQSGVLLGEESPNWEPKKTFLLDLTVGAEQLWKKFKAETRNQVRQAERRGVEIYEAESLDSWLKDYYAMHKAVYSRQKIKPPANPAFYQALWEHLYSRGQLRVILAKHEGKTIAGGIFPIYKDTLYFLDGASFREYQKLRANNLIQWHIISWAASKGLRFYDMVGANVPSIAHFKRGFGGVEVEYFYFHMTCCLLGKIGYRLYQRYRPWLKRLGI